MSAKSRGTAREHQVRQLLARQGWWTVRASNSLGDADVIALKAGHKPRLIEVKANKGGPYMNFRAADRAELIAAAELAGAEAWLVHWPTREQPRWIASSEWP